MSREVYWLDVDGDRTGLEVVVNGVPAERLMNTHAVRFPINEYVVPGANRIEVRMGPWPSNAEPADAGKVSVRLVRASFSGVTKTGESVLAEQEQEFQQAPVRGTLMTVPFSADLPGMVMPPFDPVDAAGSQRILDQLAIIARAWRERDEATIAGWMRGYLRDYAGAYPLETEKAMEDRVRRMVASFGSGIVQFAPEQTVLDPVPGTNLVDCLSQQGAAIRIPRATGAPYHMWAVVGLRGGEVVLFR